MRVLVTGSHGLIGTALVPALRSDGHEVVRLVRRPPERSDELGWDPSAHRIDGDAMEGVDAVVHLAGVGIGDRRWNDAYRRRIVASRVDGTTTLATAMAETVAAGAAVESTPTPSMSPGTVPDRTERAGSPDQDEPGAVAEASADSTEQRRGVHEPGSGTETRQPAGKSSDQESNGARPPLAGPRILLSASAVGWYGDTGDRIVDESAPRGQGFLAETVASWEACTQPAVAAGVRTVTMRSGIVLSRSGGALAKVLPLFRAGIGGRLGSGQQYVSFISLTDEVRAIRFLLRSDVHGPVNLTAPTPVTNQEYSQAIGQALHRPSILKVPAFALRAVVGGFADEGVLVGQRVVPTVLTRAGFEFEHPDIASALNAEL